MNESLYKRVASSVQASMEFEGLKPSVCAKSLGEDYLRGKISGDYARKIIKNKYILYFNK